MKKRLISHKKAKSAEKIPIIIVTEQEKNTRYERKEEKMENNTINLNQLLNLPPKILLEWLEKNFVFDLQPSVETVEDMQAASLRLSEYTSWYVYLTQLEMNANIAKRMAKRDGKTKEEIEDATAREQYLSTYADLSKRAIDTTSRMVTIKQQINQELRMTDSFYGTDKKKR